MSSLVSENAIISALNDSLRRCHSGGLIVLSRGIAALDRRVWGEVILAVAAFNAFTPDNDPYGEHDCGVVDVQGLSVIFKIDYYDPSLFHQSDNPADPKITRRVMTMMLAEEY